MGVSLQGLHPQVTVAAVDPVAVHIHPVSCCWSEMSNGEVESYCWWTKSCTTKDDDHPIIYRVLTIPSQVVQDFFHQFHQQYPIKQWPVEQWNSFTGFIAFSFMVEPLQWCFFVPHKSCFTGVDFVYLGISKIRTTFMQSTRNGVIGAKKSEWQFWRLLIFVYGLASSYHTCTPKNSHDSWETRPLKM